MNNLLLATWYVKSASSDPGSKQPFGSFELRSSTQCSAFSTLVSRRTTRSGFNPNHSEPTCNSKLSLQAWKPSSLFLITSSFYDPGSGTLKLGTLELWPSMAKC